MLAELPGVIRSGEALRSISRDEVRRSPPPLRPAVLLVRDDSLRAEVERAKLAALTAGPTLTAVTEATTAGRARGLEVVGMVLDWDEVSASPGGALLLDLPDEPKVVLTRSYDAMLAARARCARCGAEVVDLAETELARATLAAWLQRLHPDPHGAAWDAAAWGCPYRVDSLRVAADLGVDGSLTVTRWYGGVTALEEPVTHLTIAERALLPPDARGCQPSDRVSVSATECPATSRVRSRATDVGHIEHRVELHRPLEPGDAPLDVGPIAVTVRGLFTPPPRGGPRPSGTGSLRFLIDAPVRAFACSVAFPASLGWIPEWGQPAAFDRSQRSTRAQRPTAMCESPAWVASDSTARWSALRPLAGWEVMIPWA